MRVCVCVCVCVCVVGGEGGWMTSELQVEAESLTDQPKEDRGQQVDSTYSVGLVWGRISRGSLIAISKHECFWGVTKILEL